MIAHASYNDVTIVGLKMLSGYGFTIEPRNALDGIVSQGVLPVIFVSPKFWSIRNVLNAFSGSRKSAKAIRVDTNHGC